MLYKINGKYYMLRNREYVEVDIKLENNELNIKPKRENVIENNNVVAKGILIEQIIKDLSKNKEHNNNSDTKSKKKYDI